MLSKRCVGQTNIKVSCLGLGTVKFGRNQGVHYPAAFVLPSDKELNALLQLAQNKGVNLLDTAPAYGESEERLGHILKTNRQDWIISTKVGEEFNHGQSYFNFSRDYIKSSIERSLKRLQTDMIDIVLVHSNGEDKKIIVEDEVFTTLSDLKSSGLIRAFGISTKTLAGGLMAVDYADVVMVTYNANHTHEQEVIDYAHQKNKGIFIKKAIGSGHLNASDALSFVFKKPGISSVIIGTINPEHLSHNISCVQSLQV